MMSTEGRGQIVPVCSDPSQPSWSIQVIDELNASDRSANDLARGLSAEQLNWRPAPDAWSVGQCLEHLYKTNHVYLAPIGASLDGHSPSPVNAITPGWFGRFFIRTFIDPATQRVRGRAPGKAVPAQHVDPVILDLFLRSNDAARDLVRRASAYDVNRIRFVNPFISVIRFTVGTGLEIVWKHQRRHLLQAARVRQAPGFPH